MNRILDNGLVALALAASVVYALASLGPKALRRRLRTALAQLLARAPVSLHLRGLARRLGEAADKNAGACGGCDTCSAEPADSSNKPAAEVHVPLARIGKRR
jgi:hypothetical protein